MVSLRLLGDSDLQRLVVSRRVVLVSSFSPRRISPTPRRTSLALEDVPSSLVTTATVGTTLGPNSPSTEVVTVVKSLVN